MEKQKSSYEKIFLLKAERFCAYQERCRQEVKKKLRTLGADAKTQGKIISSLEKNDFLNEERFAKHFVSGKFRIKRWGKIKIKAELRKKNIPDNLIHLALAQIDEEEYLRCIRQLAEKKERQVKSQKSKVRSQKIGNYLLSKGFELEKVLQIINNQ